MAVINFVDVCKFNPTAGGTADFVVSSASTGYLTPAQAGAVNGATYRYRAESADLSQWEVGYGVYTSGTVTLARTTVIFSTNANAKVNFSTAPVVGLVYLAEDAVSSKNNLSELQSAATARTNLSVRELLTAARTYYVRPDGSDSNTGLVNSAGGAFLTVQKAIDTAAGLDSGVFDVTIQLAGTTPATFSNAPGLVCKSMGGAGSVILVGDEVTPSNFIIQSTTAASVTIGATLVNTTYKVRGLKLTCSGGSGFALNAVNGSYMEAQNLEFSSGFQQFVRGADAGEVKFTGNCTFSAGGLFGFVAVAGYVRIQNITITLTGSPVFSSAFVQATRDGVLFGSGVTFSGSTGAGSIRYNATENGVMFGNFTGPGSTYFPGDTAGVQGSGGIYDGFYDPALLLRNATNTLSVGYTITPFAKGTVSSGTYTPAASDGNYQYYTNNGAHTLANPTSDCAIDILCTNGASAGAITFTTFTGGTHGDALTTTNGHQFIISIRRINSVSAYTIKALQ